MMARTKRSEKGLLTPDNCVVALIDHQPQMLFGVANFDRQTIINNNVALSKAAKVLAATSHSSIRPGTVGKIRLSI
jgi:hypothetical protein